MNDSDPFPIRTGVPPPSDDPDPIDPEVERQWREHGAVPKHIKAEWQNYQVAVREHVRKTIASGDVAAIEETVERAWAAGFFDGEGNAREDVLPDDPLWGVDLEPKIKSPSLSIKQAYGEPGRANLERFQNATGGAGKIRGPLKTPTKPQCVWQAASEADVDAVWAAIGPFLGLAKFAQFRRVLQVPSLRHIRAETFNKRKRKHRPGIVSAEVGPQGADGEGESR